MFIPHAFEAYPEIAGPLLKLANTPLNGWTLEEWGAFCATISRLTELRNALKPLAVLEVPKGAKYNAGTYSIRFSDIERAKQLLATSSPSDAERA